MIADSTVNTTAILAIMSSHTNSYGTRSVRRSCQLATPHGYGMEPRRFDPFCSQNGSNTQNTILCICIYIQHTNYVCSILSVLDCSNQTHTHLYRCVSLTCDEILAYWTKYDHQYRKHQILFRSHFNRNCRTALVWSRRIKFVLQHPQQQHQQHM